MGTLRFYFFSFIVFLSVLIVKTKKNILNRISLIYYHIYVNITPEKYLNSLFDESENQKLSEINTHKK